VADEKLNLLVIMTDHQRADSLGMLQPARPAGGRPARMEVTPNLNRLAAGAAAFTRAYTTCPLCVPARTALATGVYPTASGVVYNDWKGATAGRFKPLHQHLAEAGCAVGHVGVDHVRVRPPLQKRVRFASWTTPADHARHLSRLGLDPTPPEGAEAFRRRVLEHRAGKRPAETPYSSTAVGRWPHAAEHFLDLWLARQADAFIRTRTGRFALLVNLWSPHPPLRVPRPYDELFDPEALELPANVGVPAAGEPPGRRRGVAAQLAAGVDEAQWRRVWAAHLGLLRLADDAVGRVLTAMDETGAADRTAVVFTVDHGEHLGQHAMYQKMEMYEPALRVPLLVRLPGAPPRRVDAPVSHLDVLPTLLEALGLDVPEGLDGESLLPAVTEGRAPAGGDERAVFACYSGNPAPGDVRRAVVTDRYKYVFDPADAPELYDLTADPLEMTNLAADPARAGVVADLHARCAEWHRAHRDPVFRA